MTPDQFQTTALAWVGAIVAVSTGALVALAVLLPKLAALRTQVDELFHSRDVQRADIRQNQQNITQIALATPSTPPTPPANPPTQ